MKKPTIYLLGQNDKPITSVDGEYIAFDTLSEAKKLLKKWKEQGEKRVYGNDTFYIKDVKIYKL